MENRIFYSIVVRYKDGFALEMAFAGGCTREQAECELKKKNDEAGYEKYFLRENDHDPIGWMY